MSNRNGHSDAMMLSSSLNDQETFDALSFSGLNVLQGLAGYRFSLDPILLADFVRLKKKDKVADLGCGVGILPLLLALQCGSVSIVGFELQPQLAERARRNVALNDLEEMILIQRSDIRSIRDVASAESFSVVVSNPPYRATTTGRLSQGDERAAARHELAGGLDDFLAATAYLLKSGGRCYYVYLAERLGELFASMRARALEPKRLRCVHSREGESARLVLVEGRKNGGAGLVVEPPLNVYEGDAYSSEVMKIYGYRDE